MNGYYPPAASSTTCPLSPTIQSPGFLMPFWLSQGLCTCRLHQKLVPSFPPRSLLIFHFKDPFPGYLIQRNGRLQTHSSLFLVLVPGASTTGIVLFIYYLLVYCPSPSCSMWALWEQNLAWPSHCSTPSAQYGAWHILHTQLIFVEWMNERGC